MSLLSELQRRRKDNRLILGLVLAVLVVWAAVSVVEQRADEPATITRGLLLFVLSYTNITLIVALLFVLGRTILTSVASAAALVLAGDRTFATAGPDRQQGPIRLADLNPDRMWPVYRRYHHHRNFGRYLALYHAHNFHR